MAKQEKILVAVSIIAILIGLTVSFYFSDLSDKRQNSIVVEGNLFDGVEGFFDVDDTTIFIAGINTKDAREVRFALFADKISDVQKNNFAEFLEQKVELIGQKYNYNDILMNPELLKSSIENLLGFKFSIIAVQKN